MIVHIILFHFSITLLFVVFILASHILLEDVKPGSTRLAREMFFYRVGLSRGLEVVNFHRQINQNNMCLYVFYESKINTTSNELFNFVRPPYAHLPKGLKHYQTSNRINSNQPLGRFWAWQVLQNTNMFTMQIERSVGRQEVKFRLDIHFAKFIKKI